MSTVIDAARPSELTDLGYTVADAADQWLDEHPGFHAPSRIARGTGFATHETRAVLEWMARRSLAVTAGNGNWTRYGSWRRHRKHSL
ncbi:hypothetical protein [Mycolicibacter sinensis]|uniref:Uncharacterized protein n=1 Tax=Mycolicibacter sinensis (strain JDM601) TaxID=875328 RepID=A0A1A2XV71_MYCSD|nr:hypothetical protein [Mycolicibacter sinensis]OBI29048.1 hypothetical protein A5710_22615 [Mycolicibacter sinensis]